MLRSNGMNESIFEISFKCIASCKTLHLDELSEKQALCLSNCGYNRMVLLKLQREALKKAQSLMEDAHLIDSS